MSNVSPAGAVKKRLKIAFASLHFAKVLIACRATTFGKDDYSDYQELL
ncbi:hypothetical protein [Capnocytophaga sp. oral taxon 326]|nr:hypothetical protein [Capnocytophaga sp. oral taxon 326]EKY21838.1 hypothetical protein HMPREF9073_00309 [Capnocytophaga sp. oral taxon 326 str. F0382]